MTIDKNEAQDYLATIEKVQQQTRRALGQGDAPLHLMLWGVVWLIGFSGSQYMPPQMAWKLWAVVDTIGVIGSVIIGWRMSRRLRRPGHNARIGWFWLAWMAYGAIIFGLASPEFPDVALFTVLITIYFMLAYVVIGLWLWRPLLWIGVSVTFFALLAYFLLPAYVNIIIAFLGGGALFFSGLDMYRNWR